MLLYKEFYRRYGVRLVKDLVSPVAWKSEIINYPKKSMLIWYNGTNTANVPSLDIGYFSNLNAPFVYPVLEYAEVPLLGNPRYRKLNEGKIVKSGKLAAPTFKYVRTGKEVTVPVGSEVLINLGSVNKAYKYSAHPINPYYMWHNALSSAVALSTAKATGSGRHKFIFMELPYNIPDRVLINKHLGMPSRKMFTTLPDYTFFNMLELFRFISTDYKEYSVLAKLIPEEEFVNVDLALTINNKMVIVNLATLASITDAYETTSGLKKYASKTVNKILYVFLNKVLEAAPIESREELDIGSITGLADAAIGGEEPAVDEVVLDDVIANEVIDNPEVVGDAGDDVLLVDTAIDIMSSTSVITDELTKHIDVNTEPELTDTTNLVDTLDTLMGNKLITKKSRNDMVAILAEQVNKKSPYNDGTTIGETLTMLESDTKLVESDIAISSSESVLDKTANKDPIKAINKQYLKTGLKKDIMSVMYSMQKTGLVIKEHEITEHKSILGGVDEHRLVLQTLDGGRSTIKIRLPQINPDNTMTISGNSFVMRRQRADVPIKKISNNIVTINSYYGKLFISKATYKRNDLGFWFHKQLMKMYGVDKQLKDIVTLEAVSHTAEVPSDYGLISRYTKGFKYKGLVFNFDYANRGKILGIKDLNRVEKNGTLVGVINNDPVIMDTDNNLIVIGNKNTDLGTVFDYLGLDTSKAPVEYCNVKIYKEQIPLGVLLSYYIGLPSLMRLLGTKYELIKTGTRVKMASDQYKIIFKDETYVVNRDYAVSDLVISGLAGISKITKLVGREALTSKSKFASMFAAMGLPVLYVNEIKLMENMFIDPITKQVLGLYKYPTAFAGVLLKAADMLQDDNYTHPNSLDGAILKGYERMSGMLYSELVKSLRLNANKSHFGKSKITISPFAVTSKIGEDSTVVLVDDLNPIAVLKQHEDVTYLGLHGRREETMSTATRVMHPSEIGVISEAVKDSGAVGISAYLSAVPNINSTRGTTDAIPEDAGWSSRLSTSAMLAPFGTKDDPKRLNFVSIMNAHVIPMVNMEAPYVRTGTETVVAVRASDKFVVSATEPGIVVSTSKDMVVVNYKESGNTKYPLKEWTTKEEAGVAYSHKLVPNLKKGDKFIKDDTLAYVPSFFEPDIFNNHRSVYRMGASMNVALMEAPETYEDSSAISEKLAKRMATSINRIKSIVVNSTDTILTPVLVGGELEPKTPILSIANESVSNISELDSKAIEILKGLKLLSPKAGYRGVVSKIRVYYNCELKDLTPSLRKLAKLSDEQLEAETGFSGRVDSGYSIQGTPLLADEVEIKYYIKTNVAMGTGDKAIIGNQLKFTVGSVYSDPITTETGDEVECVTSTRSIEARIVNSPGLIGTTSKLLEVLTDKVVGEYFT